VQQEYKIVGAAGAATPFLGRWALRARRPKRGSDAAYIICNDFFSDCLIDCLRESSYQYQTPTIDNPAAINCLHTNGYTIYRSDFTEVIEVKLSTLRLA